MFIKEGFFMIKKPKKNIVKKSTPNRSAFLKFTACLRVKSLTLLPAVQIILQHLKCIQVKH